MWTTEITNDPTQDYQLYIEILEDGKYRGRLECNSQGQLEFIIYSTETHISIPANWLMEVIQGAQADLVNTPLKN